MENGPFEDVFPIEHGIFHCYVSLPEGTYSIRIYIYTLYTVHSILFFPKSW